MNEKIESTIKKAYKRIVEKYKDVELENSSFIEGKIWINLIIPNSLIDNEEFEGYLAEIGTDIILEDNMLLIFNPMPRKIKVEA